MMTILLTSRRTAAATIGCLAAAMPALGQAEIISSGHDVSRAASVLEGAAGPQNILFFGNSYTGEFLGQRSVPDLVSDIAEAAGRTGIYTKGATSNGRDFAWHVEVNTGVISSDLPAGAFWDFVVMQNFSTRPTVAHPAGDLGAHRTNAVALYEAAAAHSPDVVPVFFQTWARGSASSDLDSFPGGQAQMLQELRDGYNLAAADIDAAAELPVSEVAPVGDAWENALYDGLHAGDQSHATARGRLLSALVIYSTIFDDDTHDLFLDGSLDVALDLMGLAQTDGDALTQIADHTVGVTPCFADVNGDGLVLPDDFNAWVVAFNANLPTCDQNRDGLCDPADFNAWVLNFDSGCP